MSTLPTEAEYPPTWYAATGRQGEPRSALSGEQRCRVGIVGGGLAGLSVAIELARREVPVMLLEANRVAWGASGRNGGFVTPGFALDMDAIAAECGEETAARLYALSREGAERVRENIRQLAPDCLMGEGKYAVSRYPAAAEMQAHARELREVHGDRAEYLDTAALREAIRSTRYFDGVFKPDGFHIHPLNYSLALADEIESLGGRVYEGSRALRVFRAGDAWTVDTGVGRLTCEELVICTSGYDAGFYAPISRSVLPVATHVAVTEPLPDNLRGLLPAGVAIADTGMACDYYRLVDEGRLLWGGKITTVKTPPQQLDAVMKRAMTDVFPALEGVRTDYRWSGLMGYCRHRMPVIRRLEPGLWVSTAFGGHGLNTTAMGGILVADAITRGDERWRDLSRYDLAWHGGPVGRAAVQATYWWMQAVDRYREARAA